MQVVVLLNSVCCGEVSESNTYVHWTDTIKLHAHNPHAHPNLQKTHFNHVAENAMEANPS